MSRRSGERAAGVRGPIPHALGSENGVGAAGRIRPGGRSRRRGETARRPLQGLLLALLAALALAVPAGARADDPVEFYATVDRDRIALDETVRLQVTLSFLQRDEPKEVVLPETPDFEVVSQGRSDQMSFSFGGGSAQFRKVRTWTMVLRPLREGKLEIRPGRVEVAGKRYETGSLTVEVGPAGGGQAQRQRPQQRQPSLPGFPPLPGIDEDPFDLLLGGGPEPSESDLFLRATVDEEKPFVGEQVTLTIWLMSRVDIAQVETLKMPKLDGFWAEEIESPRQLSATPKTIDGVTYRAYLVQRRALFPLRAGEVAIDPVELDVVTGSPFFGRARRRHLRSPGATIQVQPLPAGAPAGAPDHGNVGAWEFSVEAAPLQVAPGDPVTVRIRASGTGNLRNLVFPSLGTIDGFKVFEPTVEETVRPQGTRYGGTKTLEYVLVPERAGNHEIPALRFSFFDPETERWQTRTSAPIALTVLPGKGVAAAETAPRPPEERPGEAGLEPIRQAPVVVTRSEPIWDRPWFPVALLAPALLVVGAALGPLVLRRRRPGEGRRRRNGDGAGDGLAELRRLDREADAAFFAGCERLLRGAAGRRLGQELRGRTLQQIDAALAEAGVAEPVRRDFSEALAICEAARYAPPGGIAADARGRARDAAERALAGLEEAAA